VPCHRALPRRAKPVLFPTSSELADPPGPPGGDRPQKWPAHSVSRDANKCTLLKRTRENDFQISGVKQALQLRGISTKAAILPDHRIRVTSYTVVTLAPPGKGHFGATQGI
jgi:hypothetical protein